MILCLCCVAGFNLGLVDRISGKYLDVGKCWVEWNHEDGEVVGGSSVVTVHVREHCK